MVTPSFVTSGVPVIFSRMTLRPFGPEGRLDGFGELVHPCLEQVAGFLSELEFLGHGALLEKSSSCYTCAGKCDVTEKAARVATRAGLRGRRPGDGTQTTW